MVQIEISTPQKVPPKHIPIFFKYSCEQIKRMILWLKLINIKSESLKMPITKKILRNHPKLKFKKSKRHLKRLQIDKYSEIKL